jgi:hypothetical protein
MTVLAGTLREVQAVACETHFVETSDAWNCLDFHGFPGSSRWLKGRKYGKIGDSWWFFVVF